MLVAVDPLLQRIEALPEPGCYNVTFLVDAATERDAVMKVIDGDVVVPEASLVPGWSPASDSLRAVLDAVRAVDLARQRAEGSDALLRDIPGGWDVSVGNVVLDSGHPACVAHGKLEPTQPPTYTCPECGAQALYGAPVD